jgi:Glycosyl transferase family 2
MSSDLSVVAIIAAYNEADIIGASVRDLIDQGISVYLLDDGSTDCTVQAVEPYVGRGVIGIERLRPNDAAGEFALQEIVRRKAQLADELDADWFINHDADEFRESPWSGVPLGEAISRVDALGYNAIDFASFDFHPTDPRKRAPKDVRAALPFYSEAAVYDRVQIRCWKKTPGVELESTGGHDTQFDGRRVFPLRFILRHYPIRSQAHGERKVFQERRPRYATREQALGWHVQYDHVAEGASFIKDSSTLTRFDPVAVRIGLSLRHRGVEALEQSLDSVRAELDGVRSRLDGVSAELADRTNELEGVRAELTRRTNEVNDHLKAMDAELTETRAQVAHRSAELAARREEIAGLRSALDRRKIEIDNLQAVVADFMKQLYAFQRSLSWRWTSPLRAVYRLLTRR